MVYVEAPEIVKIDRLSLFLAGGITGCYDWQKDLCELIKDLDLIVFNPRRKNFDVTKDNAEDQIRWEYQMLNRSNFISFWFSGETVQPIALFELGKHIVTPIPMVIGIDPNYCRKLDIEIQARLERPGIEIVSSLGNLAFQIRQMIKNY